MKTSRHAQTAERPHAAVKVGDRLLTTYGIIRVSAIVTRTDGRIEYRSEHQSPEIIQPWQTVTVVTKLPS